MITETPTNIPWMQFWTAKAADLSRDELRVDVGDQFADVRDADTGDLVEHFTTADSGIQIEARLIAVVLDRLVSQ